MTQQVGEKTNAELRELFEVGRADASDFSLSLAKAKSHLDPLRFVVEVEEECVYSVRFMDVGALVYYLKAVPWEVPEFTIEKYAEPLLELHRKVAEQGYAIDASFHSFMVVARK